MTDYASPKEVVQEILSAAKKKADLSIRDMILRGILAGVFLGYATSLAVAVTSQGMPPILGAILFPVGFVILVLLGLELATGNFALLPAGLMAGEVSFLRLLRNWSWVYLGNLVGCVFYAALFYLAVTNCGASASAPLGDLLKQAAQKKTLGYMALGTSGWASAFIKGILCNWMVTLGAVLAMVSRSTIGKIAAMWLPIMTFFALGYEHSIVNMFVIPAGMMFGAPVSMAQWLFWNQLPVTVGNIFSGALFTGIALYVTYGAKQPSAASEERIAVIPQPDVVTVLAESHEMNPV
jgi:formate/nitrite transporter